MSAMPIVVVPSRLMVLLRVGLLHGMVLSACSSGQTEQPRNYPDVGSPQAQLYVEKCSQCHAAPLPSAHSAKIWPSVLDRMQVRMKTKHVPPLSREEMSIILGYLQQHAKKVDQPSDQTLNGSNK